LSIVVVYIVSSEIDIAFAKDSIVLTLEPLADYPAPYEIPPTDSAEPPSLDNSPSDGSVEYIELYSTLLEYFDLTHYGAVADGRIDSSSVSSWLASKNSVMEDNFVGFVASFDYLCILPM